MNRSILSALFGVWAGLALAQDKAVVVSACGTPPGTYTAGETRPVLIDTNGKLCDGGGSVSSAVTSVVPGTAATNLGKAEDGAAASGDTGVAAYGIQTASPADTAAEGDYVAPQISGGRLWTSTTVTSSIPGVGATNSGKAEDAAHTSGDTGTAVFAVQKATPADVASEGDYAVLEISAGRLWASAVVTDLVPGVAATNIGKAEDAVHTSSDTGVMALGVATDGATALSAAGDYSVLGTDTAGNVRAVGSVASGATDAGNPVKVAGVYNSTLPTFTTGQRGDLQLGSRGSANVTLFSQDSTSPIASGTPADGGSNSVTALLTQGYNRYYNGSTWDRAFTCPSSATISVTAGNTTELIALVSAKTVRVCSFAITESLAGSATFVYGTGTNCATGQVALTGAMVMATSGIMSLSAPAGGSLFRTASANALCLTAVTGNITGFVTYAQF